MNVRMQRIAKSPNKRHAVLSCRIDGFINPEFCLS